MKDLFGGLLLIWRVMRWKRLQPDDRRACSVCGNVFTAIELIGRPSCCSPPCVRDTRLVCGLCLRDARAG